jgi:hypothetical protein
VRKFDAEVIRPLVAGLILVGLAVGIWALWPRENSDPSPSTVPAAVEPTTTTLAPTSTTTLPTTSTTAQTHVVTTVEEAEGILRALWFGWFEGIYNQDEQRIRQVVGTQAMLDAALAQFGVMEFDREPRATDLTYSNSEILRADQRCLVVWTSTEVAGFNVATTTDVHVLRFGDEGWVIASLWQEKNDLWDMDCESRLEPLSPD